VTCFWPALDPLPQVSFDDNVMDPPPPPCDLKFFIFQNTSFSWLYINSSKWEIIGHKRAKNVMWQIGWRPSPLCVIWKHCCKSSSPNMSLMAPYFFNLTSHSNYCNCLKSYLKKVSVQANFKLARNFIVSGVKLKAIAESTSEISNKKFEIPPSCLCCDVIDN